MPQGGAGFWARGFWHKGFWNYGYWHGRDRAPVIREYTVPAEDRTTTVRRSRTHTVSLKDRTTTVRRSDRITTVPAGDRTHDDSKG